MLDHLVAEGVAMGVVDGLEEVDVEQQQRQGLLSPDRLLHQLGEQGIEGGAVEQAGELVGVGLQLETPLIAAHGGVGQQQHHRRHHQGDQQVPPQDRQQGILAGVAVLEHHQHPAQFGDLAAVHEQLALALAELQGGPGLPQQPGGMGRQARHRLQAFWRRWTGGPSEVSNTRPSRATSSTRAPWRCW